MPEAVALVRFSPRQRLPWALGVLAAAVPTIALLSSVVGAHRRAWSTDSLLDLVGVVVISVLVSALLFVEVRRQFKCEVSEEGFFTTEWTFQRNYPFVVTTQVRYLWHEVLDVGRSGYTMFFKTRQGKSRINLFVFKDAEGIAKFAIEQWRSKR
jgi:hypothetical protein